MGTWGTGIYDNDTAMDYLYMKMEKLVNDIQYQINNQFRLEAGFSESNLLMCEIDLLILLSEQRGLYIHLPEMKIVERWKRVYMDIWESSIDQISPIEKYLEHIEERRDELEKYRKEKEKYKKGRKRLLIATFNRLIDMVRLRDSTNKELEDKQIIKIADMTTDELMEHHPASLLAHLVAEGFNYIRLDDEISKKYNLPDTIFKIDEKGIRTRVHVDLKGLKLEFIEIK